MKQEKEDTKDRKEQRNVIHWVNLKNKGFLFTTAQMMPDIDKQVPKKQCQISRRSCCRKFVVYNRMETFTSDCINTDVNQTCAAIIITQTLLFNLRLELCLQLSYWFLYTEEC